ncbi:cytosine permease [Streptomyces sp. ISL-94]|uniref:purine-cytosine permease family protein n=1 Tax=Streptomyces sp. ISL-94 TaxID=2819190 RepID=UPI001BE8A537|nr:cytosine permease [Streptomyces sp. ISL-94]MBT2477531.1 cytosine permease [Streptomyces sp. ISL-94]
MAVRTDQRSNARHSGADVIESLSIQHVPLAERHGKLWKQGPFWFQGNFQPFTLSLGFIGPGLGLSLGWTVLASALGLAVGTFFMAFHASQGPQLGLPQMIQSRGQFGYRGVIVPLAATLFTFVGFNVVDTIIIGNGLNAVFGWDVTTLGIGITVAAVILAVYGHDWLHRAFQVLFWCSAPCWLVLSIGILSGRVTGPADAAPVAGGFTLVAFMVQFTAAAGYNISYAPYVSDYSRYLPRDTPTSRIVASVFGGAAGSPMWLIPIGAWMAATLGVSDPLAGTRDAGDQVVGGLGAVLTVLSVLALVATMGLNAYSGMLTVLTGIDSVRRLRPGRRARVLTISGLAVVWCAVGLGVSADFSTALGNALLLMLYLLVPWTAVNLVDYFFVRRGQYAITHLFRPDGIYGSWAWRGLLAYGAGLLLMVPFMVVGPFTGPVAEALGGVDVAFVVGLAVSGVLYYALTRGMDLSAEEPAVAASDRELSGPQPASASAVPVPAQAAGGAAGEPTAPGGRTASADGLPAMDGLPAGDR